MNADIRLALRQLRKAPGFALTAVLTLALAIGANAIVFSVLNALILRPLNVPHAETLFMLERAYGSDTSPSESYPDYRDLRDRNRSFDSLVLYNIMGGVGLDTGHGNPSVVWPYTVSGNYFDALGIQPYLGRFIHASEEHGQNSVPEIVLSYALWHSTSTGILLQWAAPCRSISIPSPSSVSLRRTSAAPNSSSRLIFGLPSSIRPQIS